MRDAPAILLHGAAGTGLWDALRERAAALLCEAPRDGQACGECAGCRLLAAGTHPDRFELLPDALALELGVREPEERAGGGQPSREIAIDAVRNLVDWSHATSHRGGVRVALVYPLDAMSLPAANALLKTLEEPPPGLSFFLGTHRLDRVLPTLRSRTRLQPLPRPQAAAAHALLRQRGSAQPEAVAAWCRNAVHAAQPEAGLEWALGVLAWLDGQGAAGARRALVDAAPAAAVAAASLQKIGVDLMRARHGLAPLYLPQQRALLQRLAPRAQPADWLARWQRLARASAESGFALHAGLSAERWLLEFGQLHTRSED